MKFFNTLTGDKKHPQLLIESIEDLNTYILHDSVIRSKQAADFWIAFKTQTYRTNIADYYQHEKECRNTAIQCMLAVDINIKAQLTNQVTSLIEYCSKADKFLADKYSAMLRFLNNGQVVRTNHLGGFCPYEDGMFEIDEMVDVDSEEQVKSFILDGRLDISMKINKKTIVIENSDNIPESLIETFQKISNIKKEDIQVFNTFKLKTILWKEKEFFNFFKKGLEDGLENIVFESSFQDLQQFKKLKTLLEAIMSTTSSNLNVYIKMWSNLKIKAELEEIQKNSKNINIVLL